MRNLYLLLVRNKDHFLFTLTFFISTFLLLNNDDPRMKVIRGKTTETVAFISSSVKSQVILFALFLHCGVELAYKCGCNSRVKGKYLGHTRIIQNIKSVSRK